MEATGGSNGGSWGAVTDEANDGRRDLLSFASAAGGRANCEFWGEFAVGTYDD